jgi:nucleoid DNA-binding protein
MDEPVRFPEIVNMVADKVDCDKEHVYPVLKILVNEMINQLVFDAVISIVGFGEFSLRKLNDFDHHVFREGGVRKGGRREVATNRKTLRFRLEWKLRQKLIEHLAKKKTFGSGLDDV